MKASPAIAFAVAVLAVAVFSLMDAAMKELVLALGTYTALLWRNVAGTVISGAVYAWHRPPPVSRAVLRIHLTRGAVATAMMLAFFWGLARVPLAQAVALTFIAPLLSLYLAAVVLGERVGAVAVGASLVAFAGVAVIVAGSWRAGVATDALQGSIAILASAVLYAWNIVLMRRQALVADPVEVAFSQSLIVTLLLAVGGPWLATVPALRHAPLLILAAALSVVALLLFAWAYARSDAQRLSTSEYTAFVWAALLGWWWFDEAVGAHTLVGSALIVAGCAAAARWRPTPSAGAAPLAAGPP